MGTALTKTEISKKKRNKFLEVLSETGHVTKAAQAVGYANTAYLHKIRREDKDFKEAWDLAVLAAGDKLLDEADRRAREGVIEDIYYKGQVVGHKYVYSDSLLMFLLRGIHPDKFGQGVGKGGGIQLNFGVAVLPVQAQNEEAWEERAVQMHDNQEVITLEAKPEENNMNPTHVVRS